MIERQQHPYEYLVRFNADGSVRGQHIRLLHRVVDTETGEVLAEREGEAQAVGTARALILLETALGTVGAQLARAEEATRAQRTQAEAARAAALRERDAEQTARLRALAHVQAAVADRDAAVAESVRAVAERDAAIAARDVAIIELEALRARLDEMTKAAEVQA